MSDLSEWGERLARFEEAVAEMRAIDPAWLELLGVNLEDSEAVLVRIGRVRDAIRSGVSDETELRRIMLGEEE